MAGNGFLRTVNFGGFDKKDVLAYVDELNSKIYNLDTQLAEKNETIAALEASGAAAASGDFEGKALLEKRIEDSAKKIEDCNSRISELMASTDTMKLTIANYENDIKLKDEEISKMKTEIESLSEKLKEAEANVGTGGGDVGFDIGSVFIEAKKSADLVVQEAKKAAKKMEAEAKELQDQILDDANIQAEKIIKNANAEAKVTLDSAKANADAVTASAKAEADAKIRNATIEESKIRSQSKGLRDSVSVEFTELNTNIQKLSTVLNDLFGDSIVKIDSAKELVANGLQLVEGKSNFNNNVKGSDVKNIGASNLNNTQKFVKETPKPQVTQQSKDAAKLASMSEMAKELKKETEAASGRPFTMNSEPVKAAPVKETPKSEIERAEQKAANLFSMSKNPIKKDDAPKVEETPIRTSTSETPKFKMTEDKKKGNARDMDMLAALAKEIQAQPDDGDNMSDEEILSQWKKK